MRKIYISASGFSNEAVRACVKNNLYYLHELLKLYNEDRQLNKLENLKPDVKSEILSICDEMSSVVESEISKSHNQVESRTVRADINSSHIPSDLSLEQLRVNGFLSVDLYQALEINNIIDIAGFIEHYRETGSFRDLRRIGKLKNYEAINLVKRLNINIEFSEPANIVYPEILPFSPDNVSIEKLKILFDLRKQSLKNTCLRYFNDEILAVSDKTLLSEKLNKLIKNPDLINAMGVNGITSLQNFLNEYVKVCTNKLDASALDREHTIFRLRKLAWIDERWLEETGYSLDQPLKTLSNIIFNSVSLRDNDLFILKNLKSFKITNEHKGLKYDEAVDKLSEFTGEDIPIGSFKGWVYRLRKKLPEVIEECLEELPELSDKLEQYLKLEKDFVIFSSDEIARLNDQNNTGFSNLFFDILITILNKNYKSFYSLSNEKFEELAYLKEDYIKDENELKEFFEILSKAVFRLSGKYRKMELLQKVEKCFSPEFSVNDLVTFLVAHNNEISFEENLLVIPPSHEPRRSLGKCVIEILKEKGEAMHYNEIVESFKMKFPDQKLSAYRSLRDALDKSDLTMPLGGRSNYYILAEWEQRYFTGPYKKIIIDYLEGKQPQHFYSFFKSVREKRPEVRIISIIEVLNSLSEIIHDHKGGFHSLKRNKDVDFKKLYPRLHASVYKQIEQNVQLLNNKPELISVLKKEFPQFEEIQLEYAIYQFSEKQI